MEEIDYIELSFIKGLGNKTIKELLSFYGTPENIFNADDLEKTFGKKVTKLIKERDTREAAEKEYQKASEKDVKIIHFNDKNYPENLKEIPDPPVYFYLKGELPIPQDCIAVVGSRKFSTYGKVVTRSIVKRLIENNITVVSGMASGIDSIAHRSCIENGGKTIAVLGSGIDVIYPSENVGLYRDIVKNGAVISEFPLGTKPSKFTFPQRNRIVAGLSYGTIVVEAPKKSGSLITANLANEYGRAVFAVPTNINNPNGEGCNELLKQGAYPLTSIEDIFHEIPFLKSVKTEEEIVELSEDERVVFENIKNPITVDELLVKTGKSFNELLNILFSLQMKGLIVEESGFYQRS